MAATPQVLRLLWSRFAWRHWRQSPMSSLLLLAILALGVAAFFSIRLANRAAIAGFADFTEILTSQSDGLITAPVGTLPVSVLGELRRLLGNTPVNIVPVVETSAVTPRQPGTEGIGSRPTFELIGLDLPAMGNLPTHGDGGAAGDSESSVPAGGKPPARPAGTDRSLAVYITAALARSSGLTVGSPLPLVINDHLVALEVGGIAPDSPNQPKAPASLLLMDLPALQRLTGKTGRLDRVEFVLEPGSHRAAQWAAIKEKLEAANPPGNPRWIIGSSADRRESGVTMSMAFRLNLTLLSLLALLVGLYLVFQGLNGAVVRRRNEIAILRSLGVTAGQIQAAWLVEAAAIGFAGGLLGLGLGWLGAQLAVKTVGQTVHALYSAHVVSTAGFDMTEALTALAVSLAASTLAGWRPSRLAAMTPPAQIATRMGTSNDPGGQWLRRPWLGVTLALAGIALTFVPPLHMSGGGRLPLAGYIAALCWIFSAGMAAGYLLTGIAWYLRRSQTDSVALKLASSHLRAPSGRHRLAAAGLVSAVSMTAGMVIFVGSFETTMRGWIGRTFQADLYISSDGDQTVSAINRISANSWQSIANDPAVKRANVVQCAGITIRGIPTILVGNDPRFYRDYAKPTWVSEPLDDAVFDSARNGNLALASESFSERFGMRRGDVVQIPIPGGSRPVTIAGIFADYGNQNGSLLIERSQFTNWFATQFAASVILALRPGQDAEAMRAQLRREHPGFGVYTSRLLSSEALRIFRQTFAITYALELIGVVVAVAGLAFTMSSLLWERRNDLATLRALGLRRREIAAAAAFEGGLLALAGLIAGLIVSFALGWLLIYRINKQTFGWTLQSDHPWGQLAVLTALVMASACLAGWFSGKWATRLPSEREE